MGYRSLGRGWSEDGLKKPDKEIRVSAHDGVNQSNTILLRGKYGAILIPRTLTLTISMPNSQSSSQDCENSNESKVKNFFF